MEIENKANASGLQIYKVVERDENNNVVSEILIGSYEWASKYSVSRLRLLTACKKKHRLAIEATYIDL